VPKALGVSTKRANLTAVKLLVDVALTLAVLLLLSVTITGLAVHEWLGIALIVPLLIHLLLNWAWVVATLRRLFGALPFLVRLNSFLNLALFVTMTIALSSGLMISVVALPFFGLLTYRTTFLLIVHFVSADMLLLIAGLHLGMNWKWVSAAIRRQIVRARSARSARIPLPSTVSGRTRAADVNERRSVIHSARRVLGRSLLTLAAGGITACGLYALSQSYFAAPLANAMDVSTSLITLDALVRGTLRESNRGRYNNLSFPSLGHAAGDLIILGCMVSAVVLVRHLTRRRSRNVRSANRS
jgi:hypothetical protein